MESSPASVPVRFDRLRSVHDMEGKAGGDGAVDEVAELLELEMPKELCPRLPPGAQFPEATRTVARLRP